MKYSTVALMAFGVLGVTEAKADTVHFGVHGGFGTLNSDWTLDPNHVGTSSVGGAVAGIQAGWDHPLQGGSIGAEADLSFFDLNAGFDGGEGIGVKGSLLSSLRLRASLSNGPFKPFLTAGLGLGKFNYTEYAVGSIPGGDVIDTTRYGFVVGGGVDNQFSAHWSGRLEGLYYLFGQDSGSFADTRTYTVNSNVFVVRAGLNYNF